MAVNLVGAGQVPLGVDGHGARLSMCGCAVLPQERVPATTVGVG